uniref:Ig-like domain-containing protein n=1 Tax=Gopherus agassizii TaxID=38772 RepID=A0A452J1M3_9SAUR
FKGQILLLDAPTGLLLISLEIPTSPSPVFCLMDKHIELHCNFTIWKSVKLEDVAVKWTINNEFGEKTVYQFDGKHTLYHRNGALVNPELLTQGSASLNLHNVTLDDEGIYTCTVLITPQYGSGTIQLQAGWASHYPLLSVLLSPQNPEITAGGEKTFSCDVHQFYPQEIDISWLVRKYGSKHERPLTQDICTGVPLAHDKKGMFTVLSRVTREVSEEDDGSLYICEVRHESLEKPLRGNTTIFVTSKCASFLILVMLLECSLWLLSACNRRTGTKLINCRFLGLVKYYETQSPLRSS